MNYRTFDDYQLGFSHVKNGTGCEDYSGSYTDPDGRFHICVVCDGHSDHNCFRSAKGAKYGCESAIEILTRFFELYYEEMERSFVFGQEAESRLKRSIKQCWDNKVFADLQENPIQPDEMEPLSERVREYYKSGRGLQNIYGATFLAMAVCTDGYLALHIGDGVMLCVDEDGTYFDPLSEDAKSETGSPASLCDSDLFSRAEAFRCVFSEKKPLAMFVSTDGIGDCMDQLQFKEFIYSLLKKFEEKEEADLAQKGLNHSQKAYLESCVKYWADKGHGVEDDCSLAGIYLYDMAMPKVKIKRALAEKFWRETVSERNEMIRDYETRKADIKKRIDKRTEEAMRAVSGTMSMEALMQIKEKTEELKKILKNIEKNELEKLAYFDARLEICKEYVKRADGMISDTEKLLSPTVSEEKYVKEDEQFWAVKEFLAGKEKDSKNQREQDEPKLQDPVKQQDEQKPQEPVKQQDGIQGYHFENKSQKAVDDEKKEEKQQNPFDSYEAKMGSFKKVQMSIWDFFKLF